MVPSPEQIHMAAYFRWLRRGAGHGLDLDDWGAAEQEVLFSINYRVVAHYRLNDPVRHVLGSAGERQVCRFCELSPPGTRFASPEPSPTIPVELGNLSVVSRDLCEECRERFASGIDEDFLRFARPLLAGSTGWSTGASIPIPVYKGLVRMGLSLLPARELDGYRDAMEWVSNPDHDLDGGTFAGWGLVVHRRVSPRSGPWLALARRVEDDAPMPFLLFFLGTGEVSFEVPLPLGARDEDLDGRAMVVPRVASPVEPLEGVAEFLPVATQRARRAAFSPKISS